VFKKGICLKYPPYLKYKKNLCYSEHLSHIKFSGGRKIDRGLLKHQSFLSFRPSQSSTGKGKINIYRKNGNENHPLKPSQNKYTGQL
jgi:hypothetical protein